MFYKKKIAKLEKRVATLEDIEWQRKALDDFRKRHANDLVKKDNDTRIFNNPGF